MWSFSRRHNRRRFAAGRPDPSCPGHGARRRARCVETPRGDGRAHAGSAGAGHIQAVLRQGHRRQGAGETALCRAPLGLCYARRKCCKTERLESRGASQHWPKYVASCPCAFVPPAPSLGSTLPQPAVGKAARFKRHPEERAAGSFTDSALCCFLLWSRASRSWAAFS